MRRRRASDRQRKVPLRDAYHRHSIGKKEARRLRTADDCDDLSFHRPRGSYYELSRS